MFKLGTRDAAKERRKARGGINGNPTVYERVQVRHKSALRRGRNSSGRQRGVLILPLPCWVSILEQELIQQGELISGLRCLQHSRSRGRKRYTQEDRLVVNALVQRMSGSRPHGWGERECVKVLKNTCQEDWVWAAGILAEPLRCLSPQLARDVVRRVGRAGKDIGVLQQAAVDGNKVRPGGRMAHTDPRKPHGVINV